MTVATGTLTGTLQDPTGAPLVGAVVTATPQVRGSITAHGVVVAAGPVTATTDASGHFTRTLAATDDPATNPTGFTYRVTITPPPGTQQWFDPFSISVPTGATIDLSTVVPAASSGGAPSTITPQAIGVDSTGTPYLLNTAVQDGTTQPDSKHLITRAAADGRYALTGNDFELQSQSRPGGADQTAVVQGELQELYNAGGGTLVLPVSAFGGVSVKVKNLTLPNDGQPLATQPTIVIRGQGAHCSGRGTVPTGGSILEFTGTDTYGLIKTNGLGNLVVRGVTLLNQNTACSTPFLYTTNTTLRVTQCAFIGAKAGPACDQDAIVCGGTTNVEGGSGWTDGFQGYGTVIAENYFAGIRRAVFGRTFFNANVIRDNVIWSNCGFTAGAAIDIDGDNAGTASGSKAVGNVIRDNLIELTNYQWGIRLGSTSANTVHSNNLYDSSATTKAGVRCETTSGNNTIHEGATPPGLLPVDDQATSRNYFTPTTQGITGVAPPLDFSDINYPTRFYRSQFYGPGGLLFQPLQTMPDTGVVLLAKRGPNEATDAGGIVWQVTQNGALVIGSSAASGGNITGPYSKFTNGGRTWSGVGTATGQTNGSNMAQDSGPGGSYFDLHNYGVRFYDHNSGPLRMRVGAGKDGFDLGAASDATVQRAAAGIVNVGKLAVTNEVAATTLGAVTGKVEIFNAAGVSLGFVPVYGSIT